MISADTVARADDGKRRRAQPVWYRSREQRILMMLGGYVSSAFVGVFGLALIDVPGATVGCVVFLVTAGAGVAATHRAARAGVKVDELGVTIVNVRSITIEWAKRERFSVEQRGLAPRVGVALTGWIDDPDLGDPRPDVRPRNRSAEKPIDALNARLRSTLASQ